MNKVKRVKELIIEWEAVKRKRAREFCKKGENISEGVVKGLKLTLDIIVDDTGIKCTKCIDWKKVEVFTYCPDCGNVLYTN